MASPAPDGGGGGEDDVSVILTCTDTEHTAESDNQEDQVIISTADVNSWDFPSILRHKIIKVKANRSRLMEHSSYFRGLIGGNFSGSNFKVLSIQWNRQTFLSLLASMFDCLVDITSDSFLPLLEGALYFGVEMLLLKCKMWLTAAVAANNVSLVQLDDLINIWNYGSEHVNDYIPELCTSYLAKNFMWAICDHSFGDIPHALLLSCTKHPHLTVHSEKNLCDALLAWIAANEGQCTKVDCIDLLKQIRVSLLPLWFAAGKNIYQLFSMFSNESFKGAITLRKHPFKSYIDFLRDGDLLKLKIRLTDFTERVDLSGCPQIRPEILLLCVLPCNLEPLLRKKVKQLYFNHKLLGENSHSISWEFWPSLTFKAVKEIDISNCPMLHLEAAIQCFSTSFPSLRTLKASYYSRFRTTMLWQLVKRCPLLCDIDLTVDVTPVIPTQVLISFSYRAITPQISSPSFDSSSSPLPATLPRMSKALPSNITKLILEGRIDVKDSDLQIISEICVSLCYLSLKGCTSVSDAGISAVIRNCVKLNSIVACDTLFGQQSILALCSSNNISDNFDAKQSGKSVSKSLVCNLQMLHMGGCKGINAASFSELMSQAHMLKSLCLREAQVDDDALFKFFGSSLKVLDVSNTKVSATAVAHVVSRNPGLQCLKTRGCWNFFQQESKTEGGRFSSKEFYFELRKASKLEELAVGWGFSCFSLETLKPAVSFLKVITVGVGGLLGHDGLTLLPAICPLLETVILYFQVISDHVIINMLESLKHLKLFALCHCLGEISPMSLKVSMPNLRKLRLERVAPWMTNADLVNLSQNCANLVELSLKGCTLLDSESQEIISNGWPGLTSIHLEECGDVTKNGVLSLFNCYALEDILLRHNGSGIQKDFINEATSKLPMVRKLSLDRCDATGSYFDIPDVGDRHFLSYVKIAKCEPQRCALALQHIKARRSRVHSATLVIVWDGKHMTQTEVIERV